MNRNQRRKVKKREANTGVLLSWGLIRCVDDPAGEIKCTACKKQAAAHGILVIEGNNCTCKPCGVMPVCEACFETSAAEAVIVQMVWPGVKISKATNEQQTIYDKECHAHEAPQGLQ